MALTVDIEKRIGDFLLKMNFSCGDDRTALLGASGAGKSMTLKCIAGIERPDRGRIVLNGRTLFDSEEGINIPVQKRRVGYLFQDYALFPNMTVYQNILSSIRKDSAGYADRKRQAEDIIKKMNLSDVMNNKATELSGGQKQRTALARILVNDADIMLLDEPFSAIDEHLKFRLYGEVEKVIREFGKTVIIVTHDRDEAYRFSDKIIIVDKGKTEAADTVENIFRDPVTIAGARLTGVKNITGAYMTSDGKMSVPAWNMILCKSTADRKITAAGIRMHSIRPENEYKKEKESGRDQISLSCIIDDIRETPFTYVVSLRGEGFTEELLMEVTKDDLKHKKGDSIMVNIDADSIMALGGSYELQGS